MLGAFVEIGADGDPVHLDAAIDAAFGAAAAIHRLLSFHDPESELSILNRARGEEVELHPLTVRAIAIARAMMLASDHLFNCTVGGALVRRGVLPDHGGARLRDSGTANDILLAGFRAQLGGEIRVTLDGIAKGLAVDLAILALRRRGISSGWVNAGGDMRAFGHRVLPILQRRPDGCLVPLGGLCNRALATSCVSLIPDPDYPGLIVSGGGKAPEAGVWSVTAATAWRADALTKVAALAPAADARGRVARLGGRVVDGACSSQG